MKRNILHFLVLFVALSGCSGNEKIIETEENKQIKNILILFPEDMGNHMSSLGTSGISTPELDALASEGVRFTSNFCGQPVCSPSKGTIYTGRYPHDNGMIKNTHNFSVDQLPFSEDTDPSDYRISGVKEDFPTLVEILKENGYFTAITSKTHVQPMKKFPFDMGWGRLGSEGIYKPETWKELLNAVKDGAADKPFFLMANTSLTHAPWQIKLVENGISSNPADRLAPPTSVDWEEIPVHPFMPDTEVARKDLSRYFAMVQLVDDWVGVIMNSLEEAGLAENTLVIFTPDHGMPYQRGKVACYPAGTQVPLIIKGPGISKGLSLETPVSHVDLMPTILEYLNIDIPNVQHGNSLCPLLTGRQKEFEGRKTVLTETNSYYKGRAVTDGKWYYVRNYTQPSHKAGVDNPWLNPPMNIDLWMPDHSVYDNQVFSETIKSKDEFPLAYELLAQIVEGRLPQEELYNLENDPWAVKNLAENPVYKNELERMRKELQFWKTKTNF